MKARSSSMILLLAAAVAAAAGCGDHTSGPLEYTDSYVRLLNPRGGDSLRVSTVIRWRAYSHIDPQTPIKIDLHFSPDTGETWEAVATWLVNDGEHLWDFTDLPPGDGYRVKVVSTDTSFTAREDVSGVFSILGSVFITGFKYINWDITHAFNEYGMAPEKFGFGHGGYAIEPLNDPTFVGRGQYGYPSADYDEEVIGVEIAGDARAYPISVMWRHAVVNDRIGGRHVSVVF